MGCNHRRREEIARGRFARAKDQQGALGITHDTVVIHRCLICQAIRLDTMNEYCFSQGRWSERNIPPGGRR